MRALNSMNAWIVVVVSHMLIEMLKLIDHTNSIQFALISMVKAENITDTKRPHHSLIFTFLYCIYIYIYIHIYSWFLSPCVYIYTSMCTNNFFFLWTCNKKKKKPRQCEHRLISFSHKEYKEEKKKKRKMSTWMKCIC
jgi:hypothetical protein